MAAVKEKIVISEEFEVSIKRITIHKEMQEQGEYRVVDERPYKDEEVSEMSRYDRERFYREDSDKSYPIPLKKVYGHLAPQLVTVKEETKLYNQTVNTLDLGAVIKAVNKL